MTDKIEVKSYHTKVSDAVKDWSPEQIAVIQKDIAKNTTASELAYFLNVCQSHGLNPFKKEIWCYKDNKGNLIIFVGKSGRLSIAHKNENFGGIRSCEVCENDTFSIDVANNQVVHNVTSIDKKKRGKVTGAYARVFRKDGEATLTFVEISDYDKGGYGPWTTHKADMIKKCAEVKALSLAFHIAGVQNPHEWEVEEGTQRTFPKRTEFADMTYLGTLETMADSLLYGEQLEAIQEELRGDVEMSRAHFIFGMLKEVEKQDPMKQGSMSSNIFNDIRSIEKKNGEFEKVKIESDREQNCLKEIYSSLTIEDLDIAYKKFKQTDNKVVNEAYEAHKKSLNE